MRLLFFALICFITLLIVRSLQRRPPQSTRAAKHMNPGDHVDVMNSVNPTRPPVPPGEIIDVTFQETTESGSSGAASSGTPDGRPPEAR
jgi:hypothetical protein